VVSLLLMRKKIVILTRNRQTTVPKEICDALGVREGARFLVEAREGRVVLTPIPSLEDLAGSWAGVTTPAAMKAKLDRLREDWR